MTFVGLITLAGFLVSFSLTIRPSVHSDVHKAWWCLFVPFVAIGAAHNLGVDNAPWWYALSAMTAAFITIWAAPEPLSSRAVSIALLFVFNTVGFLFDWGQYQLIGVDILDVGVWVQLALLFQLSRDYPEDTLTRPSATTDDAQSNVSRVVHDDNYGTRRAHSAG